MSYTNQPVSLFLPRSHSARASETRSVFGPARALLAAVPLAALLLLGCGKSEPPPQSAGDAEEEGPLEKAGRWTDDKAEEAVQKTGPALKGAGEAVDEAAEKTSGAIDEALDNPRVQPKSEAPEKSEEGDEAE